MAKSMLFPVSFAVDVLKLTMRLEGLELGDEISALCQSIDQHFRRKSLAYGKRNSFSKYKAATPGSAEREALRQEYLLAAGIHPDWQSSVETSP